eukprot:g35402.t1
MLLFYFGQFWASDSQVLVGIPYFTSEALRQGDSAVVTTVRFVPFFENAYDYGILELSQDAFLLPDNAEKGMACGICDSFRDTWVDDKALVEEVSEVFLPVFLMASLSLFLDYLIILIKPVLVFRGRVTDRVFSGIDFGGLSVDQGLLESCDLVLLRVTKFVERCWLFHCLSFPCLSDFTASPSPTCQVPLPVLPLPVKFHCLSVPCLSGSNACPSPACQVPMPVLPLTVGFHCLSF